MRHRYVPQVSSNPAKLAWSLLRSENPAARSAMYFAAAGLVLSPVDCLLSYFERKYLRPGDTPDRPIVLIVGPPRSGTTLIAQYLINVLDVCYLNNLTSIFPRSPLTANRVWGQRSNSSGGGYRAFYGRSRGLSGVNDGLHIWDRWLGSDRSSTPLRLEPGAADEMPAFFAAMQRQYDKPVVNKVNRLNVCASLVAECLPTAKFLFVRRDPLFLAQSLLTARKRIGGDESRGYGVQHPNSIPDDPVADVCRQVIFHRQQMRREVDLLTPERAIWIQYEEFCTAPFEAVRAIVSAFEGLSLRSDDLDTPLSFSVSNSRLLPATVMDRIEALLNETGDAGH